jgi:hypothetical protein
VLSKLSFKSSYRSKLPWLQKVHEREQLAQVVLQRGASEQQLEADPAKYNSEWIEPVLVKATQKLVISANNLPKLSWGACEQRLEAEVHTRAHTHPYTHMEASG